MSIRAGSIALMLIAQIIALLVGRSATLPGQVALLAYDLYASRKRQSADA
jgi:hypothetical protein